MNKRAHTRYFLIVALAVGLCDVSPAETTVDVSPEWKAHSSSAPIPASPAGAVAEPHAVSSSSSTCECEPLSTSEKLEQCTFAFTGKATEVHPPKKGRRTIVFDVDEIFKGSPKPEMDIIEELSGTDCDLSFEAGQNYLIYARWEWGSAVTSQCMGSKLLEKSVSSALGPSQALKDKLYIRLRNACMGRRDTACCLSSLKAMRDNYYVPEPEGGCPSGTVPDRLRCTGSYNWCIPLTEKGHRQTAH